MFIEELIKEDKKLDWDKMIYPHFNKKQKRETLIYGSTCLLMTLVAIVVLFYNNPDTTWFGVAGLVNFGLMIFATIKIRKSSGKVWNKLEAEFQLEKETTKVPTSDEIRMARIQKIVVVNNALNREDIALAIGSLKYQSTLPAYQYRAFKLSNALFFVILGVVIKSFNPKQEMPLEQVLYYFCIFLITIFGISLLVFVFEKLIFRDLHISLIKNRYNVRLIRYLEEISLTVKK